MLRDTWSRRCSRRKIETALIHEPCPAVHCAIKMFPVPSSAERNRVFETCLNWNIEPQDVPVNEFIPFLFTRKLDFANDLSQDRARATAYKSSQSLRGESFELYAKKLDSSLCFRLFIKKNIREMRGSARLFFTTLSQAGNHLGARTVQRLGLLLGKSRRGCSRHSRATLSSSLSLSTHTHIHTQSLAKHPLHPLSRRPTLICLTYERKPPFPKYTRSPL